MASLSLRHIYKKYPGNVVAVKDVNLEIKDKEFIVLVGPSGCGKSTTLRMIAGLEEISEGELYIGDRLVNDIAPKDRDIAMVFQSYALYPHMSIYDNMAFGLKLRKMPKAEIDKRVREAARILDIEHLLDRKPKLLSGGQRQRVAMGRAIVREPKVFLMDEPLSNLDAKLRESVRVELRTIQQKMGLSVIYVTHDQSEALSMSDAVVVLKDGEAHQVGTPQEIYFEPKTQFVADFIGTTNLISVEGKGNNDVAYGNTVFHSTNPVTPGARYIASVRPESIKISLEKAEGKVNIKTSIVNRMFLGEKVRYFVKDELDKEWIVDMFDPGKTLLSGDAYVTFKAEKAWVIEDK